MRPRPKAQGPHGVPRARPPALLLEVAVATLLLGLLLWAARFAESSSFGLYEDDYSHISLTARMSAGQVLTFVGNYIRALRGHARPLSDSFIYLLSFVGWRVGGLRGLYLLAWSVNTLNAGLFYALLRRIQMRDVAVIGGLAYVLFSADTTQAFLTHAFGLQPSLTLILIMLMIYTTRARPLAYGLGAVLLFSYETTYLLFLAAPLLDERWETARFRRWGTHVGMVLLMMGAAWVVKLSVGEGSVAGLTLGAELTIAAEHAVVGPMVSLGTYLLRPIQFAEAPLPPGGILFAACAVALFPLLLFLRARQDRNDPPSPAMPASGRELLPDRPLLRLFLAGLVLCLLAYPLTFTTRATAISGRETRVHLGAVVGASVAVASVGSGWLRRARRVLPRALAAGALSLLFAGLAGFGATVQADYARAWQLQKDFWSQLVPLIPDAGPGTVVLVDPAGLQDTRQIGANTWNLPNVLSQIYDLPTSWTPPPRVFRATPDWRDYLILGKTTFGLNGDNVMASESVYTTVDRANVIVIHSGGGALTRRDTPLVIDAVEYPLKRPGPPLLPSLPHGELFDVLLSR